MVFWRKASQRWAAAPSARSRYAWPASRQLSPHVSTQCSAHSTQGSRTHVLLKCTWDSLQSGSHVFGHKISLKKFKVEIISSIFWDHNSIKQNQLQEKSCKKHKPCRLNYMLLNNQWAKEGIKEKSKTTLRQAKNRNICQNLWDTEILRGSSKQHRPNPETREISND